MFLLQKHFSTAEKTQAKNQYYATANEEKKIDPRKANMKKQRAFFNSVSVKQP
jgi:hypothetical protein